MSGAKFIPTSTGFVNRPQSLPGKGGEYRNGALTIQIVKLSGGGFASGTIWTTPYTQCQVPGKNCLSYISNGGIGLATGPNVIYEATVFWHAKTAVYNNNSPYAVGVPSSVAKYIELSKK